MGVMIRLWLLKIIIALLILFGLAVAALVIMVIAYGITAALLIILGIGTEDEEEKGDK